jgi:FG-GAP-like repeat
LPRWLPHLNLRAYFGFDAAKLYCELPLWYADENEYEQRSVLMRISFVERSKIMVRKTSSKTGKRTQRPGLLIAGSIIFAGSFALGLSVLAGNMSLPEQNMVSGNTLQPDGATHNTHTDSQTGVQFPNASEAATDIGGNVLAAARATVADFNGDGHPDYVLRNLSTHQTAIWYLNNNVFIGGDLGPIITVGWNLDGAADFNRDAHPDYALFNPGTDQTAIWYMSGPTRIASAFGPTLPDNWELTGAADFNGDGFPDYVLFNSTTDRTAIWYLNNNVYVSGAYGPTLPVNWFLVGVADFNGDGHEDYLLFNVSNHQTAIWYLSGSILIGGALGPSIPSGWTLVATADFNSDGHPDYLLYNSSTRQTAIWYLNNNVYVSGAFGPTLPAGWSLLGQ